MGSKKELAASLELEPSQPCLHPNFSTLSLQHVFQAFIVLVRAHPFLAWLVEKNLEYLAGKPYMLAGKPFQNIGLGSLFKTLGWEALSTFTEGIMADMPISPEGPWLTSWLTAIACVCQLAYVCQL